MGELLQRNASIASATDQTVSPCTSTITITDTGPDIYGTTSNVASGQVVVVAVNGTNYQSAVDASGNFQITGIAAADAAAADGIQIQASTDDGAGCNPTQQFVFTECKATISVAVNGPDVSGTTTNIPAGRQVAISVNGTIYVGTTDNAGDWSITGISSTDAAADDGGLIRVNVDDGTGCTATVVFTYEDDSLPDGTLDPSQINAQFYNRNADGTNGTQVTQLNPNCDYNFYINRVDSSGAYLGGSATPAAGFMTVDMGSEWYVEEVDSNLSANANGTYSKYYWKGFGVTSAGTATFSFGVNDASGNLVMASFTIPVVAATIAWEADLSTLVPDGSFTDTIWSDVTGLNRKYSLHEDNLSIVNFRGDNWLKSRMVPSDTGSERVTYISKNMPNSTTGRRRLEQTVYLPADFKFGGSAAWSQHKKIGFGIAGRLGTDTDNYSISSGGDNHPESYSLRWITRGLGWKGYSYHQDTGNRTSTTGEEYVGPTSPQTDNGTPIVLDTELHMVLEVDLIAGTIKSWIDDEVVFDESGLTFMDATQILNILTFGGWDGGSSTDWSPSAETEFYVKDVRIVDCQ